MTEIVASGIVPANQTKEGLNICYNIQDPTIDEFVSPFQRHCNDRYFDNATLVDYFNETCKDKQRCEINISNFTNRHVVERVEDKNCFVEPARMFIQFKCHLTP